MNDYLFQYCQKLVVFSCDNSSVLFAKRRGEAEFDEYYSLIGGKMETTDGDIIASIQREKDEEVGKDFRLKVCPMYSCYNVLFRKKDGTGMILPHYVAVHCEGLIQLNAEEYSQYKWVPIRELDNLEPKVDNTGQVVKNALRLLPLLQEHDFQEV